MSINVQVSPIPNVNILVGNSGNLLNLSPQGYTLHSNTHISGGIDEVIHNNLRVQGGQSGEYYHLTQNEYSNNLYKYDLPVYQTGDQEISGSKSFSNRPHVNGTGVLLSGEFANTGYLVGYVPRIETGQFYAASNPSGFISGIENIVYTTGNQYISGIKIFGEDSSISDSAYSHILGGGGNIIFESELSTIVGGAYNTISGNVSSIGGGVFNRINGFSCDIVGGYENAITGDTSIIAGGTRNSISGRSSIIVGGYQNVIRANYSSILGGIAATILPNHDGATVLADGQFRYHFSKGEHTCSLDFASGVYISSTLNVSNDVYANNLVYKTGNQTINQLKNFTTRPTVNGTGVLLIDELDLSPYALRSEAEEFYQTTADVVNEATGLYVLNSETGIFITQSQTGLFYAANNPSGFITGVDLSNYSTISYSTGISGYLQNQISDLNNVTGDYVLQSQTGQFLVTGAADNRYVSLNENQTIYDTKSFANDVYINRLFVTGTETIANTTVSNIQSPYILLNLTGGAFDGGIFFVTGEGLTGINDSGAIIGFDHSDKFKFGISTRASDLSSLNTIASEQQVTGLSGYLQNQIASTGSTLNIKIDNLSGYINSSESNIVYATGNQNISGVKTFKTGIFVEGSIYTNNQLQFSPKSAQNITQTIYSDSSDQLVLGITSAGKRVYIGSSSLTYALGSNFYASKLAIGTSTVPTEALTVVGNISASGNISGLDMYSNGNRVATVVDPARTSLTGDGTLSTFNISGASGIVNPSALIVAIDGAMQEPVVDYTVLNSQITFTSPLANGSKAVVISPTNTLQVSQMIPADGSVTSTKLDTNIEIIGQLTAPNQTASTDDSVINKKTLLLGEYSPTCITLTDSRSGWTANTAIGGSTTSISTTFNSLAVAVSTTLNSEAYIRCSAFRPFDFAYIGDSYPSKGLNWSRRHVWSWRQVIYAASGATLATTALGNIRFGHGRSNTAFDQLTTKGVGLTLVNGNIYGMVHDGNSLNIGSIPLYNVVGNSFEAFINLIEIISDNGVVHFYVNSILIETLSNGPTGYAGQEDTGISLMLRNTGSQSSTWQIIQGIIQFRYLN